MRIKTGTQKKNKTIDKKLQILIKSCSTQPPILSTAVERDVNVNLSTRQLIKQLLGELADS